MICMSAPIARPLEQRRGGLTSRSPNFGSDPTGWTSIRGNGDRRRSRAGVTRSGLLSHPPTTKMRCSFQEDMPMRR